MAVMLSASKERERSSKQLSLKEAALLAGVTEKQIRHELAGKVVKPRTGAGKKLCFSEKEVFYFRFVSALPFELRKPDRKDLFELIAGERDEQGPWRREAGRLVLRGDVPTQFRTADLAREVTERLRLFLRGKRRIVSDSMILGGEDVFEGTRISVRHVGELVNKGVPPSELLEDFPSLTREDLEFARLFVALGRRPGRPKKLRFIREPDEAAD